MTKNISLKIQYAIFACLLWVGLSKSTQAQFLYLDYSLDSTCMLNVSLLDSTNNIASFNPPYYFSISGITVNSNSLASATIDLSSLPNRNHNIEVVDGNQNYYFGNTNISCGQTSIVPSFALISSLSLSPTSCTQCNGSGRIQVLNSLSPYTFEWSDGFSSTNSAQSQRNDLCPGVYTIIVTDLNGNKNATSLIVPCNNNVNPQIATCSSNITQYLDINNQVNISTNDLSTTAINNSQTQAYIIDESGYLSENISFDCNDLGYHFLTLLLIDSVQQISDTCNVLVNIQDTLGTCNGITGSSNGLYGLTTDASACNTCNGSYTFIGFIDTLITTSPTTFVWNDSSNYSLTRTDLCPNRNYVLSASDVNGTIHTAIINVGCIGLNNCIDSNKVDISLSCPPVYAPVCGCDNVTYTNACVAAYTYGINSWRQGACSAGLTLNISTTSDTSCSTFSSCYGSATISVVGGTAPYNISWSNNSIVGFSPTNICPGNYTITVHDIIGNITTSIVTIGFTDCVWPGDTDNNTVANNFDLLPIGLAYSDTVLHRMQISNLWMPYASYDWTSSTIPDLPNKKHFDSNGDGTIDSLDINAILQNYGRSYSRSSSLLGISPFGVDDITLNVGDSITTPIYLGNIYYPVTDAYAVAFTINYNPNHIKASSISANFNGSWFGNDLLHIQKSFDQIGQLQIAISRKDKRPISGYGSIGALNFTIKDDLIMGRLNIDSTTSPITISDIRLINHQNIEIGTSPVTGGITILKLLSTNTSIDNTLDIQLFPNPTNSLLNITSRKAKITSIQLFNATGVLIDNNTSPNQHKNKISMKQLPTGIYFLSIQTDQGIFNQKIKRIH